MIRSSKGESSVPSQLTNFTPNVAAAAPSFTTDAPPAYQSLPWVKMGGPPGGLGYDIRMRPDNPKEMFVTSSPGGIFKSSDGGSNWSARNEGIATWGGSSLVWVFTTTIDPHDRDTIWAGTQLIAHIYRSADGGQTWEERDNGLIPTIEEHSVRGITVDPNNPNIVYAGLEEGKIGGSMGEVYKSTDAGLNWTRIWYGDNLARYIWVDPSNSQRLYVSTGIFDRIAANSDANGHGGGVGILRSDDGGQTWTVLNESNGLGGLFIPSLFMHPTNPNILLAAVTGGDANFPAGDPVAPGVYKTVNGGDTWQLLHSASVEAVEIAPSNPNVYYAAGVSIVFRSDDAGQTWIDFLMKTPNRAAGTPIDLQIDPNDPYHIFVNSYGGGNMVSTDGGATWTDASQGYTGSTMGGIAVAPGGGGAVFAGADTATFRSDDGGRSWVGAGIPDKVTGAGGFIMIGDTIIASSGTFDGAIYRSFDGGTTWITSTVVTNPGAYAARALAAAPSDMQTVYLGYGNGGCLNADWPFCETASPGFFRSSDGGATWAQVTNATLGNASILNLAVAPDDPLVIFMATTAGPLRSQDGGSTWQVLSALDGMAGSGGQRPSIATFTFDPFDPAVIYAGSTGSGMYRSQDGGASWAAVSAGMNPNQSIRSVVTDPNRPGVVYASASFSGVFVSTDGAVTWQPITTNFPDGVTSFLALSEDGSVLYAGSGGAGVFRLGSPIVPRIYLPMVVR